ncbi:MAG: PAS domain S-box protein [Thermoplasmata archaeon]
MISDRLTLARPGWIRQPGEAMSTHLRDAARTDDPSVLTSILEASPQYSIVATDLDGKFLLWNEGARRIYGYEEGEVIGRNIRLLHLPNDIDSGRIEEIFTTALSEGRWEGVIRRVRKGGEAFPTQVDLTVRRDRDNRPIGFLSISKDISEEMQVSQRLLDSEEYNRVLVESTFDGLFALDPSGIITDVNLKMELMTGVAHSELIGTPFRNYVVPPTAVDQAIRRVLNEGHAGDLELVIRQADGSVRNYTCNANTIGKDPERVKGLVVAVRDVTEQKQLQEELEDRNRELEIQNERVLAASRMKTDFLASMSHELRTPLNSIIGFSDFLLTGTDIPLDPELREYLAIILNSGNHLLQLINDVLDLAKVESGKLELSPALVDIPKAVDEVCSTLLPQLSQRRLHLVHEVDPQVRNLVVDPLRFKQILYNLLSNAVKFTPPEGRVEVSLIPSGASHVALQVKDTGIGIPAKDLSRVFQEFEQLDAGPGKHYSGTGLGLPLTRRLVTLMGGSIGVASEVDAGTTFTVRLPWLKPSSSYEPAPAGRVSA